MTDAATPTPPPKKIQYYLIHNEDPTRRERMIAQFEKYGFDHEKNVKWVTFPSKEEMSDHDMRALVQQRPSISNGAPMSPEYLMRRRGLVVCGYKHYLCLYDFTEEVDTRECEYAVIMEDNATYTENVFELLPIYIKQLNENYGADGWDILFNHLNNDWGKYVYGPTRPDLLVYPKPNEISALCAGSTKSARFYVVRREFAKKMRAAFLPFNNGPDLWMNDLFRKLGARSFWVEPANVIVEEGHVSATECLC